MTTQTSVFGGGFLTVSEAADIARTSAKALYESRRRLAARRRVNAERLSRQERLLLSSFYRVNGRWRIGADEFRDYLTAERGGE